MLADTIRESYALWCDKKEGKLKREPGFHASSAGNCIKKVIIESMFPEDRKPFPVETKMLFGIGHTFHDQMDEMLRLHSQEITDFLWIQPWRLITYGKVMQQAYDSVTDAESPLPLKVFGTPDFIGIHVKSNKIIFCDFKTTNERAYAMKKKGNRSANYAAQVGTYLPGVFEMFKKLGITTDFKEVSIMYICKSDFQVLPHAYEADYLVPQAKGYWDDLARSFGEFVDNGCNILPQANPPEDWMCRYCNVFTGIAECRKVTDVGTLKRMQEPKEVQDELFK